MKRINVIFRTMLVALFSVAMLSQISVANDKSSDSCNVKECKIETSAFSSRCKMKIEGKVLELDGVKEAFLDMSDRVLTVKYDENKANKDLFLEEIKKLGYDCKFVSTASK